MNDVFSSNQPVMGWSEARKLMANGRSSEHPFQACAATTGDNAWKALLKYSRGPWRTYDGGDHVIFIGEIVDVQLSNREPPAVTPAGIGTSGTICSGSSGR
jgi:hypothetical protein